MAVGMLEKNLIATPAPIFFNPEITLNEPEPPKTTLFTNLPIVERLRLALGTIGVTWGMPLTSSQTLQLAGILYPQDLADEVQLEIRDFFISDDLTRETRQGPIDINNGMVELTYETRYKLKSEAVEAIKPKLTEGIKETILSNFKNVPGLAGF